MNSASAAPILPGQWLGMLGGGQLGRMFCFAAQSMGYKVCVLDPDPRCPAGAVADRLIVADYRDEAALAELAALCPAVSTEFENVPSQSLGLACVARREMLIDRRTRETQTDHQHHGRGDCNGDPLLCVHGVGRDWGERVRLER